MKTGLQHRLREWSKETLACYLAEVKKLGEDTATSFYNQSDLSRVKDCDIMIIGINPGMGCPFSEWNEKKNLTHDYLYYGNPCFRGKTNEEIIYEFSDKYDPNKRRKGWDLWVKIHKILGYSDKGSILMQLDRFVITNMIFFGTNKQKDLPQGIDTIKCAKQTLQLIEILRPKVVLLLGKECKNLFKRVTNVTQMETLASDKAVSYYYYNNLHVISICHTAYFGYYTDENMMKIGNVVGCALDNPLKKIKEV